jgi:type IV pilus assembly protein PilA
MHGGVLAIPATQPGREGDMRKSQGFSLIELLIVVAIILIIAAIAIPSLMRARIAAMVGDTRTVVSAEATFSSTAGAFAPITCLPNPAGCSASGGTVPMLDTILADTTIDKGGYDRDFFPGAATAAGLLVGYVYSGVPVSPGRTGIRGFAADSSGLICWTANGTVPANAAGALAPCANPL